MDNVFAQRAAAYDRPVRTPWKLCVQLRVQNPSMSVKEVAKALGFSAVTVYMWMKDAGYQRYEDFVLRNMNFSDASPKEIVERKELFERVRERYQSHAEEMQERLLAILETSDNEKLQADIAHDWLDRAGFAPPKKEADRGFAVIVSDEMMQTFLLRAREAKLLPEVVEAT